MTETTRGVVIGLDGAAWHLLEPLLAGGAMPRLAELRRDGAWGTLVSTVPTYTPPAWTSAVTGVNPGRHGVYGFIEGNAQDEGRELMHSGKIKAATLWEICNAQGVRCGIYNLPLTYPPRPLDGWMVSGMLTPGYGEHQRNFASWGRERDALELERKILRWAPGYVLDVNANYERDWRDAALAEHALASIKQRRDVLAGLLELDPTDVVFTVLEAPDRLQHVYYRYLDPGDALYDSPEGKSLRPALLSCFQAMDEIVGLLADYAGEKGSVIVCSDHGFTAWDVSVHLNALLEKWGYLRLKPQARAMQTGAARRLVPLAKRVLSRKLARRAKGATFSAIDWSRTRAFASPIPQQGIFVNLRGRERFGIVEPSALEELKDELVDRFVAVTAPDGGPATDRVHRSEEVFTGDALEGAPDLLPVMRDHRFELDDELFHREAFTDHSKLPRGVHHPDGIVVVKGPEAAAGNQLEASVMDVMPTLLYLAGLAVPENLDGSVVTAALQPGALRDRPITTTAPLSSRSREESSPYSAQEEAQIEEALKGLGYL